jgi:5-bromo-4-chloroindolyl phosphate hydrolysis protein
MKQHIFLSILGLIVPLFASAETNFLDSQLGLRDSPAIVIKNPKNASLSLQNKAKELSAHLNAIEAGVRTRKNIGRYDAAAYQSIRKNLQSTRYQIQQTLNLEQMYAQSGKIEVLEARNRAYNVAQSQYQQLLASLLHVSLTR